MPDYPRIICLSNPYDDNYLRLRQEDVAHPMATMKRRDFFACLEMATGREVVVLSSPPKASVRRKPRWLPPVETKFSTHRQFFCANWDVPKLRIPLSWFFYAVQVLRYSRSGDLVVIDNYEFIYVFAAWWLRIFRRVTFMLDYEDGKHLIDHGWNRVSSWLAEAAGRPLIRAATLAHPALGKRLPASIPTEVVPGFIPGQIPERTQAPGPEVRFLYSGTLDSPRGVELLLEALKLLPNKGWHLLIAGQGPLAEHVARFAQDPRWCGRVEHQYPPAAEIFNQWLSKSHVGLNCQRTSDPISGVTFPSKVFTYLSAGLLVISSKASEVEQICGNACLYFESETPEALAAAMKEVIENFAAVRQKLNPAVACERYSRQATASRIERMLKMIGFAK